MATPFAAGGPRAPLRRDIAGGLVKANSIFQQLETKMKELTGEQ